ncbi:MAG: chorismate synthase, partial [Clostridia bacterium]|nr:chorismate synthase [Clostridia bacterium]
MSNNGRVKFNIFGASHAEETGVSIDGIGFGEKIDLQKLQRFADRRKPVGSFATARREPDELIVESGIENGITTGGEIVIKIKNVNVRSRDYSDLKFCPRPSHADYAAYMKYGEEYDHSGGGKFSARMT